MGADVSPEMVRAFDRWDRRFRLRYGDPQDQRDGVSRGVAAGAEPIRTYGEVAYLTGRHRATVQLDIQKGLNKLRELGRLFYRDQPLPATAASFWRTWGYLVRVDFAPWEERRWLIR